MMSLFSFATPLILLALTVLPIIWFLLRVTPPQPHREFFPPLKILLPLSAQDTKNALVATIAALIDCRIDYYRLGATGDESAPAAYSCT